MSRDIFEFWSPSNIADNDHIHPADKDVLGRTRHNFQTECLPAAFRGPLRTAPVVLLYLSPGYAPFDSEFCATAEGRAYYRRQRSGEAPLPNYSDHPTAYDWQLRRLKQLGVSVEEAADKIAILNLGAYHSKNLTYDHLLNRLPSARVSLNYAQTQLFPEAEAGRRIVLCLRSHKRWGLTPGTRSGHLFAPEVNRAGYMHHGALRDEIAMAVRGALHGKIRAGTSPA